METLQDRLESNENADYSTERVEAKTHGTELDGKPWIVLEELIEPGLAHAIMREHWRTGRYKLLRTVNERTGFTVDLISPG